MNKIRVAIIGVGNCASSLVQGVEYYKNARQDRPAKEEKSARRRAGHKAGDGQDVRMDPDPGAKSEMPVRPALDLIEEARREKTEGRLGNALLIGVNTHGNRPKRHGKTYNFWRRKIKAELSTAGNSQLPARFS